MNLKGGRDERGGREEAYILIHFNGREKRFLLQISSQETDFPSFITYTRAFICLIKLIVVFVVVAVSLMCV